MEDRRLPSLIPLSLDRPEENRREGKGGKKKKKGGGGGKKKVTISKPSWADSL